MKNKITIGSKIENLIIVEKFVNDLIAEYDISKEICGNLIVAVMEAANNSVVHGNKLIEDKNVEIHFIKDSNKIAVKVSDEGTGFNFNNIPDPTAPENIEKITGRGIFIMKSLADEVEFSNNGNTVTLIFNLVG